MKIKKHIFVVVVLYLFGINSNAQTVLEILDKSDNFYLTTNSFEIDMKYKIYRGLEGDFVTEAYDGKVQKKGSYSKTTMVDSDIIQYAGGVLILDHQEKLISYQKTNQEQNYSPVHLEGFVQNFKKSQVTDKGTYWLCEMINTQKITQIPYGKVLFYVDKSDYKITKQVLYFNGQIPFKGANGQREMDFGRLELILDLKKDESIEKIPLDKYLTLEENGKIRLQGEYAAYELLNQQQD